MWRNWSPQTLPCWGERKTVPPQWKTVWPSLQKLPYGLMIPCVDKRPEELKTGVQTTACTPTFTATQITVAPKWK